MKNISTLEVKVGLICSLNASLVSFDELVHIWKTKSKNLEIDLHFWWQSHIYNNLQLEQQKHFQTTFMWPFTKNKKWNFNKLKDDNVLLGDMCFVVYKLCIERSKMVGTCRASHNPQIHSSHFGYPYGLSFNEVYLGGTHLDKHDRLKFVSKCVFKLDLILKFSNLKKKLGNKYEHVHKPMVFLVVNFGILWNSFWEKCWLSNVFY
jgi:hypothetical protein